jgi:hypothetical protein
MKNSGEGSRKAPGSIIRVIAAALMVTATAVILGAGPAMAADDASTPPDHAAGQSLVARLLADHVLTVEILVVLVAPVLVFAYGRRRRSANRGRSAHARVPRQAHARAGSVTRVAAHSTVQDGTAGPGRPAAVGDPWMALPPRQPARPATGQPLHADDYPSWPGRPGPYALHPDHPSWPGRPDPRWAATQAALQADGYPGWPESHSPPWHDAEPPADPREPGWPGGGGPAARRQPAPVAHRPPPIYGPPPVAVPPVLSAPVRAGFAPRADIMPRRGPMPQERPAGVIDRVQPERVQVWDAGSVELATWIISEANQQAADIRHEARDQMTASLADAKQEAAELVRKASEQATATLTAAEQEAAEIRATITHLSAELGGVAAQVTQNLVGFALPMTKPPTRPAEQLVRGPAAEPVTEPEAWLTAKPVAEPEAWLTAEPVTEPEARPAARPVTKPGTKPETRPKSRPAVKPGTRPAAKPNGTPRQVVAIRVAAVAGAALVLFAVVSGTTEVALHGLPFFVFRATGTGETGPQGLQEDQGPGQPDAPKPTPSHINVQPSPHSTVTTVHNGQ